MSVATMESTRAYDKAKWHSDGDLPEGLPEYQAFVHTGLYLGWLIETNLVSNWFLEELRDEIQKFRDRIATGPRLYEACDGVLVGDMLSDEGNAFSRQYFDFENGDFLSDYESALGGGLPSLYHVEDTWDNYDVLKSVLDRRFREWKE